MEVGEGAAASLSEYMKLIPLRISNPVTTNKLSCVYSANKQAALLNKMNLQCALTDEITCITRDPAVISQKKAQG